MSPDVSNNLLLLGAGASYGSETNKALAPPLAVNLFEELRALEPTLLNTIPKDIANLFRKDFEVGMLALAEKQPQMLTPFQRVMAAFFFRYVPSSDSLYTRLAKKIKSGKWDGALATLNYERMLPMALSRAGVTAWCGDSSRSPADIEICFPHGCCNLFCESVLGSAGAISMSGMNISTNGPIVALDRPDQFWNRIRNDAFPPVMSYFEPSKFTTSGANFIEQQRSRLEELIASAKKIAVIGINVREQDRHLWAPLGNSTAQIFYCSGTTGAAEYKKWQTKARPAASDTISKSYWADEFDAIAAYLSIR